MTNHLYATFSPSERHVLMLEAMKRRDEAETDRLRDACPTRSYTAPDAAFRERAQVGFDTAAVVSCDLMRFVGMLDALAWTKDVLALVPQGRKTNVILNLVTRSQQNLARDLAVGWRAFERFCHTRPGVDADTLLAAWRLPGAGEIGALLEPYFDDPPDPKDVDAYFEFLCVLWDTRVGSAQGGGFHGR